MVWSVPHFDGTTPGARVGHVMVPAGTKAFILGGAAGGRPLSDVYVLDMSASYWEKLSVADPRGEGPPALVGHSACYVEVSGQGQLARDNVEQARAWPILTVSLIPTPTPPSPAQPVTHTCLHAKAGENLLV